jgi:hypothetical protein
VPTSLRPKSRLHPDSDSAVQPARRWRRLPAALLLGALAISGLAACDPPAAKPATPSIPASVGF